MYIPRGSVFVASAIITYLKVTEFFFWGEVVYSDPGSNKRTAEEALILHWVRLYHGNTW